jgi:multiple sugar transport system permease protein
MSSSVLQDEKVASPASHPAPSTASRRRWRIRPGSIAAHAVLILASIWLAGPFLWEALTAFKTLAEATGVPPTWLPSTWHFDNFTAAFHGIPMANMLVNSVISTVARTTGQVIFSAMAAYAFARLHFPGRNVIFGLFLCVLMVPGQLLLVPQYEIIQKLHLLNTIPALFLPGMFGAFGTFLLRQFFAALPIELEEAARLDGAGTGRVFFGIMLPLARPGLMALGILTVIQSWNDLLWPLVINTAPNKMTLTVGLSYLQGQYMTNYPVLMAGSLIATIPLLVVFVTMQRRVMEGIALSGSKG